MSDKPCTDTQLLTYFVAGVGVAYLLSRMCNNNTTPSVTSRALSEAGPAVEEDEPPTAPVKESLLAPVPAGLQGARTSRLGGAPLRARKLTPPGYTPGSVVSVFTPATKSKIIKRVAPAAAKVGKRVVVDAAKVAKQVTADAAKEAKVVAKTLAPVVPTVVIKRNGNIIQPGR